MISIHKTGLRPRIVHYQLQEKNKEVKKSYEFENYLKTVTSPAHRISLTKLRLGCHALRIQTGKCENRGVSIPVEQRTCLVCKQNCVEDEKHFLMYCQGMSYVLTFQRLM